MGTKCHIHRIFMQGLEDPSNVISRGYLWCVYRISMDLFGYSMHILLVFYGIGYSCKNNGKPWNVYGMSMEYPWMHNGISMDIQCYVLSIYHRHPMVNPLNIQVRSKDLTEENIEYLYNIHCISKEYLWNIWIYHGISVDIHWILYGVQCVFHNIPMEY